MDKLLTGVNLEDRISVPTKRTMTDAGQMIVPCAIARVGTLIYKGSSLGLVDQADELIEIHRKEEDVFSQDSMDTFRSAPVTIGHPKDADGKAVLVDASNAKELQVGMLEGMPTRDEDLLTGTLVITNQEAIDTIEEGVVELSAGYTCDVYEEDGKLYQTNIKANHIAIVNKGRAGSSCSIADEAEDGGDGIGKNDDKPDSEFKADQLEAGIKHEMEHTDDEAVAKSIAKDHLSEDEDYYTKLATIDEAEPAKSEIKDISDGFIPQAQVEDSKVPTKQVVKTTKVTETIGDVSIETVTEHTVTDMNEADAANLVAEEEEMEAEYSEMDADWAVKYAQDSALMAKAHAEVAKAARKIANKKAKSMNDSADEGGDTYLATDVTSIVVALDVADEAIEALESMVKSLGDDMAKSVTDLCDVILLARDMNDLEDFSGKTVNEIKAIVVADVLDIELSNKSEAYIDARFDILCEDSDSMDTPMSKLLKKQVVTDAKPVVYKDPVAEARQKSIERNNKTN